MVLSAGRKVSIYLGVDSGLSGCVAQSSAGEGNVEKSVMHRRLLVERRGLRIGSTGTTMLSVMIERDGQRIRGKLTRRRTERRKLLKGDRATWTPVHRNYDGEEIEHGASRRSIVSVLERQRSCGVLT